MSGLVTAVVAVGAGSAYYQGEQAEKASERGAESSERVANEQAAVTREVAANAEALNRERYLEAQGLLLPRVGQADIAQRQLMAEMGLPDYYGEGNAGYRSQVEAPYRNRNAGRIAEIEAEIGRRNAAREQASVTPLQRAMPEGAIGFGNQEQQQQTMDAFIAENGRAPTQDEIRAVMGLDPVSEAPQRGGIAGMMDSVLDGAVPVGEASQTGDPYDISELTSELESLRGGNTVGGNVSYDQPPGGPGYAPSSAYMNAPGYQDAMDESLRAVEQSAVSSGSTAYGGRRLKEAGKVGAGVQQSYYNNYMNILQNMAQPQVAQNLASLGVGQGATIGQQNIAAGTAASGMVTQGSNLANQYRMEGTAASNAAISDVVGGGMNIVGGMYQGGYI